MDRDRAERRTDTDAHTHAHTRTHTHTHTNTRTHTPQTHTHTHTELQRNDTVTQIALCKIRQVHVWLYYVLLYIRSGKYMCACTSLYQIRWRYARSGK